MKSADQTAFKTILIISVIIAIAMLPFVAKAQEPPRHGPPTFAEFDQDGDGLVSEDEFNAMRAARHARMAEAGKPMKGMATAPAFADLDTDGDGYLNEAELIAGQQAHRKAMHALQQGHEGCGCGHCGKGMQHGKGFRMPTFADLDLNGDGCIDAEEFAKHQAEMHGN